MKLSITCGAHASSQRSLSLTYESVWVVCQAAKAEVVELDMDSMSEGPTPNPKKSKRKVASPAAAAAASTVGARPARAARATAKKPYVFDDSESEEEAGSEDWSGDSDEE